MSRRSRLRAAVSTTVVGALLLAACGSSDQGGSGQTSGAPGAITFQAKAEPEEAAVYRSVIKAYGKKKVDLVAVGRQDHLTRLSSSFASGSAPDVFLINYREYAQFVKRGAVEPIEPLLAKEGVDLADYYSAPNSAFEYDGKLQCMPQNISSPVIYWNRKIFADAGVRPPQPNWTWKEFAATAKSLTRNGVKGAGIESSIIRMAPFIWSNGGEVVDDTEKPTRTTLHEPKAKQALQSMVDLVESGSTPTREELASQSLEDQFMTGKIAMFMSSRVEVPALREQRDLDFDAAALPRHVKPASILHSDAYCISSSSKNKKAAAKFVAYAIGAQGQRITALGGRTVPSMKSVAESPAFLSPTREPRSSQVFLDPVPYMRHTPVTPNWPEIEDLIGTQLRRVFEDGVPLDQGLAEIRKQVDPLLAKSQ